MAERKSYVLEYLATLPYLLLKILPIYNKNVQ